VSFLLDTNICSAYVRDKRVLFTRFNQHMGQLYVSRIVVAELYTWAYERQDTADMLDRIHQFLADVTISEFDDRCAEQFGQLSASLRARGTIVAPLDLLIGATAVAYHHTLVTHNTKDFVPIPGIQLVDWLQP
jgi:tRNA(fMet)-specific endonuclease VapC